MLRRSTPALLCLAVLLVAARLSAASSSFRVLEEETRLAPRPGSAELSLAYENPSGRAFDARVTAELLDPRGQTRAHFDRDLSVPEGRGALRLALPFDSSSLSATERKELPWFRLRYHVAPAPDSGAAVADGLVSLSEITPDFFELHVSSPPHVSENTPFRARVYASRMDSGGPAPGVTLQAEAALDDEAQTRLRASAVTDQHGSAVLDFVLPRGLGGAGEVRLSVRGRLGEVTQEAETTSDFEDAADIVLGTDKPIYQPGQTLHLRALFFDLVARRALPGAEATLVIRDPGNEVVHRATLRASRLGVAAADWPIAETTPLGTYTADVNIEGGRHRGSWGGLVFTVSRYELPTFSVAAEPDRKFYLPGEDAEVTVRADYLFGKPVPRGRVRVVREASREWDFERQKWEVEEEETFEGEAGDDGRFRARIPLGKAHVALAEGDDGEGPRFRDLEYAAYFTDPSTNRTEQRRFALRVTRDPVHVYVVRPGGRERAAGFPFSFYVTTFYADGTPAQCEVEVSRLAASAEVAPAPAAPRPLLSVRSNRFGLARVDAPALAPAGELRLAFKARDAEGREGHAAKDFDLEERTAVRVETDRTVYREGEPLRVSLASNRADATVALDVLQRQQLLHTQSVRLRAGAATALIPFRREFRGELSVVATTLSAGDDSDEPPRGWRTVLYPRGSGLSLDVRLDREEYRPGHEARADIRVRDADGREVESALGVVVTDRAVEERARTDAEFGHRRAAGYDGYVRQRLGEGESFAGVSRASLQQLDASKPLPDGLALVAELILNRDEPPEFRNADGDFPRDLRGLFAPQVEAQMRPVRDALRSAYARRGQYPRDEAALRRTLLAAGVDVDALRDPWGRPYDIRLEPDRDQDALEIVSASADKERATADDFVALRLSWPYFRPVGLAVERAFKNYFDRTGRVFRDRETLKQELLGEGVDLDALRDRWGRPYDVRFEADGRQLSVKLRSGGPDGRLVEAGPAHLDDFTIWESAVDYFQLEQRRIQRALDAAAERGARFPRDEAEFGAALRAAGVGPEALLDPWGRPYSFSFRANAWAGGQAVVRVYAADGRGPEGQPRPAHLKRILFSAVLTSLGPDGRPGTHDDFETATFARTVEEQGTPPARPTPPAARAFAGGELRGTVFDPNGAVIPNALVRAEREAGGATKETRTDDEGRFVFRDLPPGVYELRVESQGFVSFSLTELPIHAAQVTEVETTLAVGGATEVVTVTGVSALPLAVDHSVSKTIERHVFPPGKTPAGVRAAARPESAETPRLREYFPETLVWQPLLETDHAGRASLRFKLADSITTWKMSVVGSTADGELGIAEAELRAFQPFFVEHDPPRVLTEGDEISLPVVLRNYLARPQEVGLELKLEPWFTALGPARRRTRVAADSSARETFDFRAVAPVAEGRQRVSTLGPDESDAVERAVSVHPDGEQLTQTAAQVFGSEGALEVLFPGDTIQGSARAELKLYPNLRAHVVESVEGIMQRPYGCGEQTISSTYPSLLVLRHHRARGQGGEPPPAAARAALYVRQGFERLLGYRKPGGGFGYWAHGEPSLALTAYALKFLSDARGVVAVDEDVIEGARRWVLSQAGPEGTWESSSALPANRRNEMRTTAYVLRALAESAARAPAGGAKPEESPAAAQSEAALKRALEALARRAETSEDPYLLASFVIAADARGEWAAQARQVARRLASLRRDDGAQTFWELVGETPFHGWGRAGHVETTALAVRALAARRDDLPPADADLTGRALAYLFRQKDEHGVWHSTQATVNVLDALTAFSGSSGVRPEGFAAEIYVNGRHATNVALLDEAATGAPVRIDLTPHLVAQGRNRVEVRRASSASEATAQLVSTFYVPWDSPSASPARPRAANAPTLKVSFDRTEAEAGQSVSCQVEASRGAGFGMLLAEVGLPPGAEVDRATLERARAEAGSGLDRYEVRPDRLVFYLKPGPDRRARLAFAFKPRYALRARTAPSQVYDYYNPEARAVVPPARFVVR